MQYGSVPVYAGLVAHRTGIREIAEKAGVSVATVSLALRDKGRMSDETRVRIKSLARESGYVPNAAARSLTSGRSQLIAISIPGPGDVPEVIGSVQYFFRLLGAAAAKALELDFGMLVSSLQGIPGNAAVDGAIVVDPSVDDPVIAACDRTGIPVVTIGRRLASEGAEPPRTWIVDNDFRVATGTMLDHLADSGSESIALLATEPMDSFQQDSISAYREWCRAGRRESRVVVSGSPHMDDAAKAAQELLAGSNPPDAVYATIDTLARAVMDMAASDGVGIPSQLRVATCSDSELTRTAAPQLTTIDERPVRLGEAAVELLIAAIADPDSAPEYVEVETELLVRESTS